MKRDSYVLSVILSAFMTLQIVFPLNLSAAATTITADSSMIETGTGTTSYRNPSYDEINFKIESIAREKQIPSILLKAIAYRESTWRQFDKLGGPLLGSGTTRAAIGIMQVASYNDNDTVTIEKLKTDIDFNIRRGAELLDEKFRFTPKIGDGDRNKLENWYFALWAYYSWNAKNNPNVQSASALQTSTTNQPMPLVAPILKPNWVPYQDSILAICAKPEGFLARYIQPVVITRIPVALLPVEGVPSKLQKWETPLPVHYGNLLLSTVKPDTQPVPPSNTQSNAPNPIEPLQLSNPNDKGNQSPQAAQIPEFIRLAGIDRVDTAIQQALNGWPQGAPVVVLARADNFPDALAGVPFATKLGAPVLLTGKETLDTRVEKTLKTLSPEKIYLLGGEGALSKAVSTKLTSLGWSGDKQIRISGQNRYDTAAKISLKTVGIKSPAELAGVVRTAAVASSVEEIVLVTGENYFDALSIASIAGYRQMPILLTESKNLPPETLQAIKLMNPKKIYLVGGEAAISADQQLQLQARLTLTPDSIVRLRGSSPYDTMAAVADALIAKDNGLCFATGEDFPDALAGAALAARFNSAVILLPKTSLEQYPKLKNAISRIASGPEQKPFIFGGTGAVSGDREKELRLILSQSEFTS